MNYTILNLMTFLPLIGALLLLFMPKESEGPLKAVALGVSLVTFLVSVPLVYGICQQRRIPVRPGSPLDSRRALRDALSRGHRRHQPLAGHADHLHHADRHPLHLERGREDGEGIHDLPAAPGSRHARHLHLPRSLPLLHLLGDHADPDVPDHRRLGREGEDLRDGQVLHLHHARLGPHAGRPDHPLFQGWRRRFQPRPFLQPAP